MDGFNVMDEGRVSRRNALTYLGLLSASVAGREFLASWLPVQLVHGDEPRACNHLRYASGNPGTGAGCKVLSAIF